MLVNGKKFNVEENGSGIPFIWGHGLMSSMKSEGNRLLHFDQLAQLSRVIRYDARGHGLSGASEDPKDYRWDNLGSDMLDIASSLSIEQFVAGGASMGCATSLYAATQAPERVKGLVLVIPPTAWETRAAQTSVYENMANFIKSHTPDALPKLQAAAPQHWSTLSTPDEQVETLTNMYQVLPTVLQGAKVSNLPDKETLKTLQMPALILCWTDDTGHPVSTAEELHRLLPNSRLTIASNLDEMSTWTEQVANFLSTEL